MSETLGAEQSEDEKLKPAVPEKPSETKLSNDRLEPERYESVSVFLDHKINRADTIAFIAERMDTHNPEISKVFLQSIKQSQKSELIGLNLDEAVKTRIQMEKKLEGFDSSPEKRNSVIKAFVGIVAKEYYSFEETNALINNIELRANTEETRGKLAKIENNSLVLFDECLSSKVSADQLEFIILHEMGHIIDYSKVLYGKEANPELESDDLENSDSGEIDELVLKLPKEFHDLNTKSQTEQGEFVSEAKANLIAIWSKNKDSVNAFVLERLNHADKGAIDHFFGPANKKLAKKFSYAVSKRDINSLKDDVRDEAKEDFEAFVDNSKQIFEYFNKNWKEAKERLGDDYLEIIGNVNGLDFEDFDLYESPFNAPVLPQQAPDSANYGAPSAAENSQQSSHETSPSSKPVDKKVSLGEVFVSSKDLIKAIGNDLDIFNPN